MDLGTSRASSFLVTLPGNAPRTFPAPDQRTSASDQRHPHWCGASRRPVAICGGRGHLGGERGWGGGRDKDNPDAHFLEQKSSRGLKFVLPKQTFQNGTLSFLNCPDPVPARGFPLQSLAGVSAWSSLELMRTSRVLGLDSAATLPQRVQTWCVSPPGSEFAHLNWIASHLSYEFFEIFSYFLIPVLLRYNLYTIKFAYFECTIRLLLKIWLLLTITVFQNISFIPPNKPRAPLWSLPYPGQPLVGSFLIVSPFLGFHIKWNY